MWAGRSAGDPTFWLKSPVGVRVIVHAIIELPFLGGWMGGLRGTQEMVVVVVVVTGPVKIQ